MRGHFGNFAPDIAAFRGPGLDAEHRVRSLPHRHPPAAGRSAALQHQIAAPLLPVVAALVAAAPLPHRAQSYTAVADPGIDADRIANHAWCTLVAPSGPLPGNSVRLAIGYREHGLRYPRHRHRRVENYLTLTGSANQAADGRVTVKGGPGTTICRYSNQPHGATFPAAPPLAAAFRRGTGIKAKSVLEEE